MTIGTGDLIAKFGTQDQLDDTSTSAVADGAKSVAADISSWTNDDDAPFIACVLKTDSSQTTPGAVGKTVSLFARLLNIQSTNDQPEPDASFDGQYIGTFILDNASGTQYVPLAGGVGTLNPQYSSQVYDFYLLNELGVSLAAGWALYGTPIAFGPA